MSHQQQHVIAHRAQVGFANAISYDAYRSSYPAEAVEKLLQNVTIAGRKNAHVIDLAAGTGKFTELLAARPEEYIVKAVEPHNDMIDVLRGKKLPRVESLSGSAADMSAIVIGWADAVVVAQAFHWFPTPEVLRELHRVLKPGGSLGLIWNYYGFNSRVNFEPATRWEAESRDLSRSHEDNIGERRQDIWPDVFKNQHGTLSTLGKEKANYFGTPVLGDEVHWNIWLTKDTIWNQLATISHIASLDASELEKTKKRSYEIMAGDDVRSNATGEIEVHGRTVFHWTRSIP